MTAALYARGVHAVGECGRCGVKRKLSQLREDGYTAGLMVCSSCYDPPHPQDEPIVTTDSVALRQPAPQISVPDGEGTPAPTTWIPTS